jgi:hypothetical protein
MKIPQWWDLLLLGAASWRSFQLIAFDDLLDRPRRWVLRLGDWDPEYDNQGNQTRDLPDDYRLHWAQFITCPYCAGAWIALAWWGAFQITPHWTLVFATIGALFCAPVAGHKLLAREQDK